MDESITTENVDSDLTVGFAGLKPSEMDPLVQIKKKKRGDRGKGRHALTIAGVPYYIFRAMPIERQLSYIKGVSKDDDEFNNLKRQALIYHNTKFAENNIHLCIRLPKAFMKEISRLATNNLLLFGDYASKVFIKEMRKRILFYNEKELKRIEDEYFKLEEDKGKEYKDIAKSTFEDIESEPEDYDSHDAQPIPKEAMIGQDRDKEA